MKCGRVSLESKGTQGQSEGLRGVLKGSRGGLKGSQGELEGLRAGLESCPEDWSVPQEGRGLVLGVRGSLEDWKMPKGFGSLRRRRVSLLGTLFDPCRLAYLAYTSND